MPNFTGTPGNDIYTGGSDNETITGFGGDDQLSGNDGQDDIAGGSGADTLNGGEGDDTLYAGERVVNFSFPYFNVPYTPPILDTGTEVDNLSGGGGSDRIFAGYGDNADGGANGTFGDKLFISFLGSPVGISVDFDLATQVIGGGTITGFENVSWIQGSEFDDVIRAGSGNGNGYADFAAIFGMGGNDQLYAGYYTGSMFGGDGNDMIDGRASQYLIMIEGGAGEDTIYSRGNSIATVRGGDGNDTIYSYGETYGGAGNDLIVLQFSSYPGGRTYGEDGDDEIRAASQGGAIAGGAGADLLIGAGGVDILASGDLLPFSETSVDDMGLERDNLSGFGGNDVLSAGYGDHIDGGTGTDSLRYSLGGSTTGLSFDTAMFLSGQPFVYAGGTIQNVENLVYLRGTNFADILTIATHSQLVTVDAGDGDDTIYTSNSSASVSGGNGNDLFISGAAGDIFDGAAGTDTIDYRNAVASVTVTLAAVAGQTGSGAGGDQLKNIENINGSAFGDSLSGSDDANVIEGLGGADTLYGNGGDDRLVGGEGDDTLRGGNGHDLYIVADVGDLVLETAGQGNDTVWTTVAYSLAASQHVERLELIGDPMAALGLTGNELANILVGNAAANALDGGGGNDTLYGGAGVDAMTGGGGDDTFFVDSAGDQVYESAGQGADRIYTSVDYVLYAGQEVETLSTDWHAGTAAINLGGNELGNIIIGNAGDNILYGKGGTDFLSGLGGNDSYYIDSAGDYVQEAAGGGFDRIYAGGDYTLYAGQSIEILSTDWNAGIAAIALGGNELANIIYGNAGSNILNGKGGSDFLGGLGGDDAYYVDSVGDYVQEFAGEGNDRIYASADYTLAAGQSIEILSTDWNAGTAAISLGGNELANTIYGNAGANILYGKGGTDWLEGLGGDDSYYIDSAGDFAAEGAGGGNDRIYAGGDYTLFAGQSIEILSTDWNAGTAAIALGGNELDNIIYGNAGDNILYGKGGNDTLLGGGGGDQFRFTDALGATNVDTVQDFAPGVDKLVLLQSAFSGLTPGSLSASAFVIGTAAADADDRIIYNSATGALLYDADGNGAGATVQFATLSGAPVIAAGDFMVF